MIPNAVATIGGPDGYGYTYDDSVPYSWIEISGSGSSIMLDCDDCFELVPIGFTFNFYGNPLTELYVSSNGLASTDFGSWCCSGTIPSIYNPTFISPLWMDLGIYAPGGIYYQTIGIAPNRQFIVEYKDVQYWYGSPGTVTFEVIIMEGTNNIKFQYADMSFGDTSWDYGADATVGIQGNPDTNLQNYLAYSQYSPVINDGLAILFTTCPTCGNSIPEFPTVALPIMSVLGIMFLMSRKKHN